MTSNVQLARDWIVAYAKAHPDKPAPVIRIWGGNRFEVQEGYAKRGLNRREMLAETARMFTTAALGGGAK